MLFRDIVEILRKNYDVAVLHGSAEAEIGQVRLFDQNLKNPSENVLYFGYDTQQLDDLDQGINLVSVPLAGFGACFNAAQDLLHERKDNDFYDSVMETADRVRNIDELIDIASQSFGASLVLIDRAFRIISYSTQVPVTDMLWSENIKKGYCDYEFITEVRKIKAVQNAGSSADPIEVTCKSSPFRKLSCHVFCRDVLLGSILLIEGADSYSTSHVEMLRALSDVLGYAVMKYAPELIYRANDYHSFLYNLLIGAPIDTQPETYLNLPFPDSLRLLFYKASDNISSFPKESALADKVHAVIPGCHVIGRRDSAIIIGSEEEARAAEGLFSLFPDKCRVKLGISNTFSYIGDLREALKQAESALETGSLLDPGKTLFTFEEYGIDVMLRGLCDRTSGGPGGSSELDGGIDRYLHPAVQMLEEYDKKNDSGLLETLKTYLESGSSIKLTSEKLFLHRNSVLYRLNKIRELCGIDPDDRDTAFRLMFSFKIIRMLKALGRA